MTSPNEGIRYLAWEVAGASWEASVIAVIVFAVTRWLPVRSVSSLRYALWSLVVLRLVWPAPPSAPWSLFRWVPTLDSFVDRPGNVAPPPTVEARTSDRSAPETTTSRAVSRAGNSSAGDTWFTATAVDDSNGRPISRFYLTPGWAIDGPDPDRGVLWQPEREVVGEDGIPAEIGLEGFEFGPAFGRDLRFVVGAPGYRPEVSDWVSEKRSREVVFRLKRGPAIDGRVTTSTGQPVPGTAVAIRGYGYLILTAGKLGTQGGRGYTLADADGRFRLPAILPSPVLVAAHPEHGYAEGTADAVAATGEIRLRPWGRIEGRLDPPRHEGSRCEVMVDLPLGEHPRYLLLTLEGYQVDTDDDGRFVIDRVPPRSVDLFRVWQSPDHRQLRGYLARVEARSDGPTNVRLGNRPPDANATRPDPAPNSPSAPDRPGNNLPVKPARPAERLEEPPRQDFYSVEPGPWPDRLRRSAGVGYDL